MSNTSQTKTNHARLDPGFHFTLAPLILIVLIWSIVNLIRYPSWEAVALLLMSVILFWLAFTIRTYALRVQDRLIRLEERLRLARLLPESQQSRIPQLTEAQLIALRFCCDDELPILAERTLSERLTPKQIKEAIQTWRPDYFRV
ncbi:MAG TPA: DUF6526 family protein [Bryobacteraceae bacterium]|jgi:hypothetical protein|nr:DUF6526 family protein [Bryobacteraceae bacterium]